MKKKKLVLKKLALDKSAIAILSGTQQAQAIGGADTVIGITTPCGPCIKTQAQSCQNCITAGCPATIGNGCEPHTVDHGCTPTAVTVCYIC